LRIVAQRIDLPAFISVEEHVIMVAIIIVSNMELRWCCCTLLLVLC